MFTKIIRPFLGIVLSLALGGCTAMEPIPTATGNPEITVNTTDINRIKGVIVSVLASNGYNLGTDTNYLMAFSKPMDGGGAVLYQALAGNSYSSPPMWNMSFTFAPAEGGTHVFGHVNITMANAFGRVDQTNVDKGKAGHEMQALLTQIKASIENASAHPSRRKAH